MMANPFLQAIVTEPRRITASVQGLNEEPLERLLQLVEELRSGEPPRDARSPGARLLVSPDPGYGKSHLIGRLFGRLEGRATLVYLRPYAHPSSCWRSILTKTVQEMEFPESQGAAVLEAETQLDAFIRGILINMAVNGLRRGMIASRNPQSLIGYLEGAAAAELRANLTWKKLLQQQVKNLAGLLKRQLQERGLHLNASPAGWLHVLIHIAYGDRNQPELRQACLDWLKAASVDEEEARAIGLPPADRPSWDLAGEQAEEVARARLADLCMLAGFFRPFVFCFDQTENYTSGPELAASLGLVVEGLTAECVNQLTLLTANQTPWMNGVLPHWQEAHKDRIVKPYLELKGINRSQAAGLIRLRLEGSGVPEAIAAHLLKEDFLERFFANTASMNIRDFIRRCSERFEELARQEEPRPKPEEPRIEDFYRARLEKIRVQPRRRVFNADALFWFVKYTVPDGWIAFPPKSRYLLHGWKRAGRTVYFGLEAGHHPRRWQAIVKEGERLNAAEPGSKLVFLRTADLRPVPGARWKTAPAIQAARGRFLHLFFLDREDLCRIYAAHDLYLEAVEGDIAFSPDAVIAFVQGELRSLWERVLEPAPENWGDPGPPAAGTPSDKARGATLKDRLRELLRREKFLSLQEILDRLHPPATPEEILRARAAIPEIQAHDGPRMTVFQWCSGKKG